MVQSKDILKRVFAELTKRPEEDVDVEKEEESATVAGTMQEGVLPADETPQPILEASRPVKQVHKKKKSPKKKKSVLIL